MKHSYMIIMVSVALVGIGAMLIIASNLNTVGKAYESLPSYCGDDICDAGEKVLFEGETFDFNQHRVTVSKITRDFVTLDIMSNHKKKVYGPLYYGTDLHLVDCVISVDSISYSEECKSPYECTKTEDTSVMLVFKETYETCPEDCISEE